MKNYSWQKRATKTRNSLRLHIYNHLIFVINKWYESLDDDYSVLVIVTSLKEMAVQWTSATVYYAM